MKTFKVISFIKRLSESIKKESDPSIILTARAALRGAINLATGQLETKSEDFAYICKTCPGRIDETDDSLAVKDPDFDFLSGKMCGACGGCVLSYKVRQSLKLCDKWEQPPKE